MEASRWLPEMGTEDSNFIDQYQMNTFGDLTTEQVAAAFGENYQQSCSSETFTNFLDFSGSPLQLDETQTCFERPTKLQKTTYNCNSRTTGQSTPQGSSSSTTPAFGDNQYYGPGVGVPTKKEVISRANRNSYSINNNPKAGQKNKRDTAPRTTSPAQDHIIAERKRREKLSQRFVELSAIIPGLKKMDKASVLGDSIKYVKELQGRMKELEEQTTKNKMDSVFFVNKFFISSDDSSSIDQNSCNSFKESLPEIEARVSDRCILIRIHCEKQKGVSVEALAEIEKLNLSIITSSIIPFGSSTLDITVLAQMNEEFNMALKDLVKELRFSFRKFM